MRFLLPFLMLMSGSALAFEQATFQFLGFSTDGSHAAYEQHGYRDGSGFAYSEVRVWNLKTNQEARAVVHVADSEAETEEQARSKALKQAKLQAYGISSRNQGTRVFLLAKGAPEATFKASGKPRRLQVVPVPFEDQTCPSVQVRGFQFWADQRSIFKDTRLPEARSCALTYGIAEVRVWNTHFLAFLRYEQDGFEGPDTRYWPVAGKLL